jgi:predicted Ser/Thr protein kinase
MGRSDRIPAPDGTVDSPTVSFTTDSTTPQGEPAGQQFLPGAKFGDRYRIVELLGRGGMGEVYRADDLQLGQTVALKFLPPHLATDATALARLRNEVRVARQIAHPNVCRVYDIGEADGQLFLSMEYIDGEDLGSVLRRLGRPTREKSVEIARQMCVALAAAHETGVLHRDLKPDNIMIDGRGRVRITDFGLAAFARELALEGRAGTPAYMAPELFRAVPASTRSDVYALGALLYELFTGQRAFRGETVSDIRHLHETVTPARPSDFDPAIEPAVEEIILRCLDKDPNLRPLSALAVAAALPGQDLVAAALAAGQTPSPEVVAEAGGMGALKPAVAFGLFLAVIAGLMMIGGLNRHVSLQGLAPPTKRTVVVAAEARGILKRLGYTQEPAHSAYGWEAYGGYLRMIEETETAPDRWSDLRGQRPPVFWLWYRESPVPLVPRSPEHVLQYNDPPQAIPGMAGLKLDDEGRLAILRIVPSQTTDSEAPTAPFDYDWLFEAAGLDLDEFVEVEPARTPPDYADARRAWTGHYPGTTDWPVRVEAASLGGKPIYFNVLESFDRPWDGPVTASPSLLRQIINLLELVILIVVLVIPPLLARRNVVRGTGDRVGAVRLAIALCAVSLLAWMLWADHTSSLVPEVEMLIVALGGSVLLGVWAGLVYLGLEPYVRRLLPETLISWTRLLMGRFTDPRVGRDVLVGGLAGTLVIVIQRLEWIVPAWFGVAPRAPYGLANASIDGGRKAWAMVIEPGVFVGPLTVLLTLTATLYLVRRRWLAVLVTFVVFAITDGHLDQTGPWVLHLVTATEVILVWSVILYTLIRFGLLSMFTAFFFFNLLQRWPFVLEPSAWFFGTTVAGMVLLGAIAALAARCSVGRSRRWASASISSYPG